MIPSQVRQETLSTLEPRAIDQEVVMPELEEIGRDLTMNFGEYNQWMPVLPVPPDVPDHLREIENELYDATDTVYSDSQTKGGLALVCAADVKPETVKWIWTNLLAAGVLNLLEGAPGQAKTMLCCYIAALVTTGGTWPDGSIAEVGNVLMINMEDDLARTIVPRLKSAGADMNRISLFNAVSEGFTLDADLERLAAEIIARKVKLVFIDPFMAVLGAKTDSHKDQDVRRILSKLGGICGSTGCGVVLVRHLKKQSGALAINNGGGSIGIIGAARVALLLATDPEDKSKKVLATVKNNLGQYDPSNSSAWSIAQGRMEYCGPADISADELSQAQGKNRGPGRPEKRQTAARDWLNDELRNGPVLSTTLMERAEAAGFSKRTMERARKGFTEREKVGDAWQVKMPQEKE